MQLKRIIILSLRTIIPLFYGLSCFGANKIDTATMRNNLKNRTIRIYYYESCNNGNGTCIDLFKDINVQMIQAVGIAEEYIKHHHNHDVKCSAKYRTDWNDDYIKCADKTGAKNYYELQFDDIKESLDNKIKQDVFTAICKTYGGEKREKSDACFFDRHTYSINHEKFINSLAKFNYSSPCEPYFGYGEKLSSTYICSPNFNSKLASNYQLKTAFGIDPRKFAHLQLKSGADLEFLLKRYTQNQITAAGQKMVSFSCAKSFQTYYTGNNFNNRKEDILTCTANGQEIDFLFDDMNENLDYESDAGTAGLNCIAAAGGVFDGKRCNGLTRTQCDELNKKVPTKWDTTFDTCVLINADQAALLNDAAKIAGIVVTGATLAAITVVTGGTGTMVFIAAVGTGTATVGSTVIAATELQNNSKARDFLAKSANCKTSDCAEDTLAYFIKETAAYYEEKDNQLWAAMDEELNRILNLLPIDSRPMKSLSETISEQQDIENIDNWPLSRKIELAGQSLVIIGSVMGIVGTVGQHWGSIVDIFKKMGNTSKAITGIIKKMTDIAFGTAKKNIGRTNDAYGIYDSTNTLLQ